MDKARVFQSNRESTIRMKNIIQALSEQQLSAELSNGWTVAVTLAHLAFWDQRVIHVIETAKRDGKVTPSNYDDSLNDILEPFLNMIPPVTVAEMAVTIASQLDLMLEEEPELVEQLDEVNHRWVDRSLHRNSHLDDIDAYLNH